ncbi:DUF4974 domain-containing protein [Chitinophaga sp. SYP-B3965]|uniref:FecR family protein n=1 Tax=Chitinophaga sp. SYP-B3965 TaxID=2663120 RepID=UPI001299DF41|nr:FecR family protein [Chitinophaga sp. SYP-B3965]MRG44391.1 DUF4974 domain-containing protein [Chitinophaga sp. SYP-B3965]
MKTEITAILYKHVREEEISPEEGVLLEAWLQQSAANRAVFEQIQDEGEIDRYLAVMLDFQHTENAFQLFRENKLTKRSIPLYRRWWAAASVLLLLGAGSYFFANRSQHVMPVAAVSDIQPGKAGAILTLADGSEILLDTMQNGSVAIQGGVIAKVTNGKLSYEGNGDQPLYNKIAIPKARQYQLRLPDGTIVWLNSASTIRYPTAFTGHERKVEITGEAYFEVAKNKEMPFVVNVNNKMAVEVLGTHFNINAYQNGDNIATTLLEGAVKIVRGNEQRVIRPGEQAQVNTHIEVTNKIDTSQVMAWRNGMFNFENTSLLEVMRQLERWYDIDVVYEKGIPDIDLIGKMTRDVPLNGLLKNLKELGVNYRLEGRILTVLPGNAKE